MSVIGSDGYIPGSKQYFDSVNSRMTLKRQIDNLYSVCFDIEKTLPMFNVSNENTIEQAFRRDLYRIRIDIGRLSACVDDMRLQNKDIG